MYSLAKPYLEALDAILDEQEGESEEEDDDEGEEGHDEDDGEEESNDNEELYRNLNAVPFALDALLGHAAPLYLFVILLA